MPDVPKLPDGKVDKRKIKALYDRSRHLDWTLFAEAQGWVAEEARKGLPVKSWMNAKKRRLAKQHAETLENLEWDHLDIWSRDVMQTMREYPRTIDFAHSMLVRKLNHLHRKMGEEEQVIKDKNGKITKRIPAGIERVKAGQISNLIYALEALVRAKHKALCIDNVSIDQASLTKAKDQRAARTISGKPKELKEGTKGFTFNVIGFEKGMKPDDVERMFANYLDTPEKLEQDAKDVIDAESRQTPDEDLPE